MSWAELGAEPAGRQPERVFEMRHVAEPAGGLRLELRAEGRRVATASADPNALAELRGSLGLEEEGVLELLRGALVDELQRELALIQLGPPTLIGASSSGRFVSSYKRGGSESAVGVVWYDTTSSTTGPEGVPALVRSKMRREVASRLAAKRRSVLRILLDVLDAMSE
jgi:hypothetical protein